MDAETPAQWKEAGDRRMRVAAGLEEQFQNCSGVLRDCMATVNKKGHYSEQDLRATALFLRTSAQIAGVIARFEMLRIRSTIPQ